MVDFIGKTIIFIGFYRSNTPQLQLPVVGGDLQVPVLLHYHQPLGFVPSPDSNGVLAAAQLQRYFPSFAEAAEAPVVMLIRSTTGSSVLTPEVEGMEKLEKLMVAVVVVAVEVVVFLLFLLFV